jgi:hypothetical protein
MSVTLFCSVLLRFDGRNVRVYIQNVSLTINTLSDVARFFWRPGRVITMAVPNIHCQLQKITVIYCVSFYLAE